MTNEQKYKTTESEEEPKSCPFCGGMTEIITDEQGYYGVSCIHCDYTSERYRQSIYAIAAHNRVCRAVEAVKKGETKNFIKAKMEQALVRWNKAQEMYEVGQMQSAANMYASAMRLYYECATDLIDGEGFVREVSQMEASNIKAMHEACGTCCAKREVAELRKGISELLDALQAIYDEECTSYGTGEVYDKWRKALKGASND